MAQVQIIQPYQPQSDELEKVAAYCRVSTDSKDQLNSYRTQIGYYTNFIAQHPGWELADIYADEGITGTSLEKRDEFKRMLQDCRAGKISRILVKSVSRFARNTLELIETTRELKDLGVVVVFEEQGIDTAQMLGEMQLTLLAMAAQEESTSISKNMRWSYQKRMENGTFLGCRSPFGYTLENGKLLPHPQQALIIQEIFERFLAGGGKQAIADDLTVREIPTRFGNTQWNIAGIHYILTNERYCGDALLQKTFTSGFPARKQEKPWAGEPSIMPLIPTLHHFRSYVSSRARINQKKGTMDREHVSMRNCPLSAPNVGTHTEKLNPVGKQYWVCSSRNRGQSHCSSPRLEESEIKLAFLNLVGKLYLYQEELLSPTLSLLEEIAARQEQSNTKLYELNTALADLNEKAHTLQRLHNKGFIEDADFREQSDALASQRKKLSDQRTQVIHGSKALETLDKLRDLQEQLAALPEVPWEFDIDLFDQLVEKIVPVSSTELLFKLKCGLELKEVIPQ